MQNHDSDDRARSKLKRNDLDFWNLGLWGVVLVSSPGWHWLAHLGVLPLSDAQILALRLACLAAACLSARYRRFSAVYGTLLLTEALALPVLQWQGSIRSFAGRLFSQEATYLAMAVIVAWVAITLAGGRRRAYVALGVPNALVEPELRVLGRSLRWPLVASGVAVASAACVLAVLLRRTVPPWSSSLFLTALGLAAINALVEELIYRAALISSLEQDFGADTAILASACTFGLMHWNGTPPGIAGVLLTAAFGVLAGRAMRDSRGLFWPWLMHFVPDVVILYWLGAAA